MRHRACCHVSGIRDLFDDRMSLMCQVTSLCCAQLTDDNPAPRTAKEKRVSTTYTEPDSPSAASVLIRMTTRELHGSRKHHSTNL